MNPEYVAPSLGEDAFDCPTCNAFAHQIWYIADGHKVSNKQVKVAQPGSLWLGKSGANILQGSVVSVPIGIRNLFISQCSRCEKVALWVNDQFVWPKPRSAPVQHVDLPSEIRADYDEAAAIVDDSPRGAAALLRLAMEKLCARLGSKDRKLDQNIGNLVSKGLDPMIQRAMDTVRVTGNEAVHPGTMDLRDGRDTVFSLFSLINLVVEEMISRPKKVRQMYDALPEGKRQGIAKRDGGCAASGSGDER